MNRFPLAHPIPPSAPEPAVKETPSAVEEAPSAIEQTHARAAKALADLVAATLATEDVHRFHDAARIAVIGRELMQIGAKKARDLLDMARNPGLRHRHHGEVGGVDFGVQDDGVGGPMVQPNFIGGGAMAFGGIGGVGPLDQNELIRHMMGLLGPAQQTMAEMNRSQAARAEAEEMESLLRMKNEYGALLGGESEAIAEIDKRLETLKKGMKVRNDAGKDDVVHPELPRGHRAEVQGIEGDPRHGLRPHAPGGGGDAGAPNLVAQVRVGQGG